MEGKREVSPEPGSTWSHLPCTWILGTVVLQLHARCHASVALSCCVPPEVGDGSHSCCKQEDPDPERLSESPGPPARQRCSADVHPTCPQPALPQSRSRCCAGPGLPTEAFGQIQWSSTLRASPQASSPWSPPECSPSLPEGGGWSPGPPPTLSPKAQMVVS